MMHNAIERSERQEMELDATDDAGTDSAGSNLRRNNLQLPTPLFKHFSNSFIVYINSKSSFRKSSTIPSQLQYLLSKYKR